MTIEDNEADVRQSPASSTMRPMNRRSAAAVTLTTVLAWSLVSGAAQQPPPSPQGQPAQPAQPDPPAQPSQPSAGPQGQRPAGPGAGAAAPRVAVPAAASSIAAKPEAFYGQYVSIYATVEKSLTPLAFTVDQDRTASTGKDVIVIAPRLHQPVTPNTYLTVMGEVVRPDAAEISKRAAWAAGTVAAVLAEHPGRPVLLASAVITPALDDLAKFLPPPLTPEEEVLDKTMKGVGAANGALRKGIEGTNAELIKTNTEILADAFADTEAFWRGRGRDDAVKMAQTARTAAQAIGASAAKSNWGDVKTHAATLAQQCSSCHGAYRERLEDGSFAIKAKPQ